MSDDNKTVLTAIETALAGLPPIANTDDAEELMRIENLGRGVSARCRKLAIEAVGGLVLDGPTNKALKRIFGELDRCDTELSKCRMGDVGLAFRRQVGKVQEAFENKKELASAVMAKQAIRDDYRLRRRGLKAARSGLTQELANIVRPAMTSLAGRLDELVGVETKRELDGGARFGLQVSPVVSGALQKVADEVRHMSESPALEPATVKALLPEGGLR